MRWSIKINARFVWLFPARLIFAILIQPMRDQRVRAGQSSPETSLKKLLALALLLFGLSPARSETRE